MTKNNDRAIVGGAFEVTKGDGVLLAPSQARALFLDRDGVINVDHGYVHRVEDFEFVDGIFDLVRHAAHELGLSVIVVTNQSGIGRGYFDEAAYQALTDWMLARFRVENAPIAKVYHAPYHPEHGLGAYRIDHPWRKPRPGMILQAATDFDLDLPRSILIGDTADDIAAAAAANVGTAIRFDPRGDARVSAAPQPEGLTYRVVRTLGEAQAALRDATANRL